MNPLQTLPAWGALLIGILVLASAVLALVGSLGLLRLSNFYRRVHAPTLTTTLGLYLMLAGAMLFYYLSQGHLAVHLILIGASIVVTAPITLMLLVRAALARDHMEGAAGVPPVMPVADETDNSDKGGG